MTNFYNVFQSDNFNDMYRMVHRSLMFSGIKSKPRNMGVSELLNCCLILDNPRNRLLSSHVRKHNYSYACGEFFWYLRGSKSLQEIMFYLKRMEEYSDDGVTLNSGYGERIFGHHKDFPNQWSNVVENLVEDPDSRQAVITVNYQHDLDKPSKDVPCTLNMQFMIRDKKLHLILRMRSNDSYMGLIYDVFSFTLFQEMMLNELNTIFTEPLEMGTYVHNSGSMHLYDRDIEGARRVCNEVQTFQVQPQDPISNDMLHELSKKEQRLRIDNFKIKKRGLNVTYDWIVEKLNRQVKA